MKAIERIKKRFVQGPRDSRAALKEKPVVDVCIAAATVALIAFGVIMVYSASAVYADRVYGQGYYFAMRQILFACIAFTLMFGAASLDYQRFRLLTYPLFLISLILLVTLALGAGRNAGGATRWIHVGYFNIQPAELMKLALILWLAHSLAKKRERIRTFAVGFLPHALVTGLLMMLCLMQPDFGSAVIMGVLCFVMMFISGAKIAYLGGAALSLAPLAYYAIANSPYRLRRIRGFLSPFEHRRDEGYQVSESLLSFGSGGWQGVGLGDSRQKLLYLPEAHTDFIGAIVGEELGFLGIALLSLVFLLIAMRAMRIAWRAPDDYGTYLATGIGVFIGLQAFVNLAVTMGMLPTKGLALPFISYGGSSLFVNALAVGVLLSVSRACSAVELAAENPETINSIRPQAMRSAA